VVTPYVAGYYDYDRGVASGGPYVAVPYNPGFAFGQGTYFTYPQPGGYRSYPNRSEYQRDYYYYHRPFSYGF